MSWRKYLPWINPLLGGLFPVLFLYVQNADQVFLSDAVPAMLVVVAASGLLMVILRLILRNSITAGFLATSWILLFLSYDHLWSLTLRQGFGGIVIGRSLYLLPATLTMALALALFTILGRRFITPVTPYISLALAVLVLWNIGIAVQRQVQLSGDTSVGFSAAGTLPTGNGQSAHLKTPWGFTSNPALKPVRVEESSMPDIYIVILDSYPRADVLMELHRFDNTQFLNHLRKAGFYVAAESQTNYMTTFLSLASMLNLEYLDHTSEGTAHLRLFDNRALWLAKSSGFRTILLPTIWDLSKEIGLINVDLTSRTDFHKFGKLGPISAGSLLGHDFGTSLIRSTMLGPIANQTGWIRDNEAAIFTGNIEQMKMIPTLDGSSFTFAHFFPPHPPYLFDRFGNLYDEDLFDDADRELYVEQLIWVNKSISDAIDRILEQAKDRSVIVVLSDHGPASLAATSDPYRFKERSRNLIAIHLPDTCEQNGMYPTITPVNILRLVFDSCLGTEFGLLEDKTFWTSPKKRDFTPLQDVLQ